MRTVLSMLILAAAGACAVSACFYDPDPSKISEEDTDITDASAVDSGATSDWPWSGLGLLCNPENGDCDEYDADYCLTDPNNQDQPGRCTIKGCDIKGCPDLYSCCDCSDVPKIEIIMCVPDAYTDLLDTFCDCS